MNSKNFQRRATHLYKSGCLVIGIEHFLVMFPSAMLIARLATTPFGSVIELPSILFACGIGTLIFLFFTRRQVPFFLGPSFAYIGFVSYQIARITSPNDIVTIRSTIYFGYIIAGICLLILTLIYRSKKVKKIINLLFPSTVMGPAISLIGLELANMAAQDSGFTSDNQFLKLLALITLACIIIFSLLRHHFLQNASILIGIILGCIIATFMGHAIWPTFQEIKIVLPKFYFSSLTIPPIRWITLIMAVFPCTMISFVESLGRLAVYEGMLKRDEKPFDKESSTSAISFHSVTSIITSFTNMMPSAIYAENLAIMNLHNADLSTKHIINDDDDSFIRNCYSPYSIYPYVIASVISILGALFSGLQELFMAIPMPILGGMELFVFGLISAPGIQMLVEEQVNYKKISNQIITASVFLAGISDISINYESLTLHGMSLGLTIGVIVNIITLILSHFGYLNEKFAITEILEEYSDLFGSKISISLYTEDSKKLLTKELPISQFKEYIRRKDIMNFLKTAYKIEVQDCTTKKTILFFQEHGRIDLKVELFHSYQQRLFNDNPKITYLNRSNRSVTIVLNEYVSKRILKEILNNSLKIN